MRAKKPIIALTYDFDKTLCTKGTRVIPMDWNEYEKKCDEIRSENQKYLALFEKDMEGLSPKTVRTHLNNVDFYINEYLLREDTLSMEQGIDEVNGYLGYFFIRKCTWSTPATIKSTAASIKKFYKCMMEHGFVKEADYRCLCDEIKENMEFWQADCAAYNDPNADDPFDIW